MGRTFNMVVANKVELASIAVTTQPTKTAYTALEVFDPTGMVVTATYSNGSTAVVSEYTYSTDPIQHGTTSIEISYTEGEITKTANVAITVSKIQVTIPSCYSEFTYDGTYHEAVIDDLDPDYVEASGTTEAINAGYYPIYCNLIDTINCEWVGGGIATKTIRWRINKATGEITPQSSYVAVSVGGFNSVRLNIVGDGNIEAYSARRFVEAYMVGDYLNLEGISEGSDTVYIEMYESTNYTSATVRISVSVINRA